MVWVGSEEASRIFATVFAILVGKVNYSFNLYPELFFKKFFFYSDFNYESLTVM
jgi:hypothetical protein